MHTRHAGTHAAQRLVRLVVVGAGLGLAYYAWPSEIADASLTFAMINQAAYAVCLALMALLIANTLLD